MGRATARGALLRGPAALSLLLYLAFEFNGLGGRQKASAFSDRDEEQLYVSSENASGDFVSTTGAAGRYAEALFDLACDDGAADAVEHELKNLRAAINDSADFQDFLKSPVYDRADQMAAITAIAEKAGLSPMTQNFLKLAASNQRLSALPSMISAFLSKAAEARGEISASAISAAPMNDEQIKSIRMEIESMVGKAVNLETRVDPDLLGGLIVKVGSKMIDSSLRTKLNKLKTVMKEA